MVADKEVAKLADMVAGHGGWLIGPKLFRPEPYPPTCVSSKLCKFIYILDGRLSCVRKTYIDLRAGRGLVTL